MALSEQKLREYARRLLLSRMRILSSHGFYGLLLMHTKLAVDKNEETACTDGVRITFGTDFLDSLKDNELDFVMMHEILHIILQHCERGDAKDSETYSLAADIVVNSNILFENEMDLESITLDPYGVSMHVTPNGKEGYEYTAEEVYEMLLNHSDGNSQTAKASKGTRNQKASHDRNESWDDYSRWGQYEEGDILHDLWIRRFEDAARAIEIRDPSNKQGLLPSFAQRVLEKLKPPQLNWRMLLNEFVQEDFTDYSFAPPDRRFDESPFFLPDFNDKGDTVKDILFMIDTSGSVSDAMMTTAYSEIQGAIHQFGGKLQGWLGFFDTAIVEPKPFSDEDEFRSIRPAGGGGTNFGILFEYVRKHMREQLPSCMVILTDGYAPFPTEEVAEGIPVLWLLNNDKVTPPWGKTARITPENY